MADAADILEGVEFVTFLGAPIIEGEGEGPTLSMIFADLGLPAPAGLDRQVKGYQVQSAETLSKDMAAATRVYRFEDDGLVSRFFDTYEEAREFAKTLKYSLVAFDPETDKWSVDELGANYG